MIHTVRRLGILIVICAIVLALTQLLPAEYRIAAGSAAIIACGLFDWPGKLLALGTGLRGRRLP